MSTYRELVYMVIDELKLESDDSKFTEDHIVFLLDKYRAFLLKQRYADVRKEMPDSNYQTLCLDLQETNAIDGLPCSNDKYLRTIAKIPKLIPIGSPRVYPIDYYQGDITLISRDRMRYIGHNRYLKNIIYCSLNPDGYLYFKSSNPQFLYIEKVRMTAIFEEVKNVLDLQCGEQACNYLDNQFPLETALITTLIGLVVNELSAPVIKPSDDNNNAKDDNDEANTRQNGK